MMKPLPMQLIREIEIDLDDGVKVNYAKFQGVEVAQEGKKALKVDLLAKIQSERMR